MKTKSKIRSKSLSRVIEMKLDHQLVEARFLSRPNRFLAMVTISGRSHACYLANPGRLRELLVPGHKVYVKPQTGKTRKTSYDLVLVSADTLVSVDSRVPNALLREALELKTVPEFCDYEIAAKEHVFEDSRLDFLLKGRDCKMLLETKSCTLVKGDTALFPDAPTPRGARHLDRLSDAAAHGLPAAMLFIVQRIDAARFSPNEQTDPAFCRALRYATSKGVKARAYTCHVTTEEIRLAREIPVSIPPV